MGYGPRPVSASRLESADDYAGTSVLAARQAKKDNGWGVSLLC
jgi:hypothetical protein